MSHLNKHVGHFFCQSQSNSRLDLKTCLLHNMAEVLIECCHVNGEATIAQVLFGMRVSFKKIK